MFFKDSNNNLHFLSDDDIKNGGLTFIPVDCVEITDEEAEQIRLDKEAQQPVYVPQIVTRFQAKAALLQSNLLDTVNTMINDPTADAMLKLAWAEALSFERNSSFIIGMATQLGLTDQQLDDLFILAASIN